MSNLSSRVLNKVKRFSVVVTLRSLLPFVVVLALMALSFLFGVWNVRSVTYQSEDLKYTDEGKLHETFNDFLGKNIFFVDVHSVESDIKAKNPFVKSVDVNKVVPSKLELHIQEYIPEFSFVSSSGKCNLYSQEGVKIYEVCTNCNSDCKSLTSAWKSIYIESPDSLDSSGMFMYHTEIGNIVKVLSEFGYSIEEVSMNSGVTILKSQGKEFIFDLNDDLDTQLARLYLVGKKINSDSIEFTSLDLRFDRPVLKNNN